MEIWDVMRWLHLLAMAFFVGGQLVLVAVIVPVMRGDQRMRLLARNFGMATVGAIGLAVLTGISMASHYGRWQDGNLHAKLALLVIIGVLIALHTRRPGSRALNLAVLACSLALVGFGVALAH